jgi:hypothetical protein
MYNDINRPSMQATATAAGDVPYPVRIISPRGARLFSMSLKIDQSIKRGNFSGSERPSAPGAQVTEAKRAKAHPYELYHRVTR